MRTEQEFITIFARNLSAEIKRAGMNKEQLAKAVGVSKATVSDWTLGKGQPRLPMFFRVCEALDCNPDVLGGFRSKERPPMIDAYLDAPSAIQQAVDGLLYPYKKGSLSNSALG